MDSFVALFIQIEDLIYPFISYADPYWTLQSLGSMKLVVKIWQIN